MFFQSCGTVHSYCVVRGYIDFYKSIQRFKSKSIYQRKYHLWGIIDDSRCKYNLEIVMYLDANNLYGWAMSQYLPTGGFRCMTEKAINNINLAEYKKDSKKGLILEVDLECRKGLHDLDNDYPLRPELVTVTENNCFQSIVKKIKNKCKIPVGIN